MRSTTTRRRPAGTASRGTAVAGVVLAAAFLAAGCGRHPDVAGHQPAAPPASTTVPAGADTSGTATGPAAPGGAGSAASDAAAALDDALAVTRAADADLGDDLPASAGSQEGDPTQ